MRTFEGVEYWNCDQLSEDEMRIIHDCPNSPKEEMKKVFDKYWKSTLPPDIFKRDE